MEKSSHGSPGVASNAEQALERQLYRQTRISELSRYFLALPPDQIAEGIQTQLPVAGDLAGAEGVTLIWLAPPMSGIDQFSSWVAPGSGAQPLRTDERTTEDFPWSVEQLGAVKIIHIDDVDALPEAAAAEQADLRRRRVLSSLTIPLRSAEGLKGFFTFERVSRARAWSDPDIALLSVMAEIFAVAADRQRRAFALRESEERFRAISEHATELVAEIDHRGNYLYVSPSYRDLLGVAPRELIGTPATRLVHPDDRAEVEATFRGAFQQQGRAIAMSRLLHADGSWRWVEISGSVFRTAKGEQHLVSIGRDVTRRVAMEEAIRRQRDSEERVAELSRHFLQLSTHEIEGAISGALAQVAELAGADNASLIYLRRTRETNLLSYAWPEVENSDAAAIDERWDSMLWMADNFMRNQPSKVARLDDLPESARAERRDLAERGVLSLLSIPIYSGKTPIGSLKLECTSQERDWTSQEVTVLRMIGDILTGALRRQQTELALDESRGQLLQAQKMDAVGRLAGGIAHDFNNLLTIILGFCRPLLSELADSDPIREDITAIHDSAERAAALTRQLLTFSRRQNVETQELQLNNLLRALQPMVERLVGHDVDLGLELADELDSIEGDSHQLEQLVLNIAANARDAMPDGGSLVMRTRNRLVSEREATQQGLAHGGHFVSLQIQDTGIGMDEPTRRRVFDPFFTTKDADKGTGLGLSLVYGIVEQLGGTVSVDAEPGKGTSFEILVPRLDFSG